LNLEKRQARKTGGLVEVLPAFGRIKVRDW